MPTAPDLRALPKVLLHEHLDGGLRAATLLELLDARGIVPPATTVAGLVTWLDARAHAGSLVEYLRGFDLTVAAMATPAAMERVAFEAAEDAHRDGCVLAEFRIAPILFEPYGISADAATEALLAGLMRASVATGMPSGLVVCGMRQQSEAEVAYSADVALCHRDAGVVGFDLAGPEAGFPATLHAGALARLRDGGVSLTMHAGEADVAERIIEAAHLGATRIGHGVRLADAICDSARRYLVDEVLMRDLHLEVCPTSNVHTGAATSIANHPIRALWDAGISLSYHTDNALISRVTMSDEATNLIELAGFDVADLVKMGLMSARHSFLPETARRHATDALLAWGRKAGIEGLANG
ncbi:MAG: adenosine deaminase family protein [Burkholderiaceae bacterium]